MIDFRENDLLFGNESNGMNLRFYKDEYFYKTQRKNTDENNIEKFVSDFLSCTNMIEGIDFVKYDVVVGNIIIPTRGLFYKNEKLSVSKSFINKDETFITINSLFSQKGINLDEFEYYLTQNYDNKIGIVVEQINNFIGINISEYFSRCFLLDALINNRDRHTGNLGIIYNKYGTYKTAPIFDNGLSFNTGKVGSENNSQPFYRTYEERVVYSQRLSKYIIKIYGKKFEKFENKINIENNKLFDNYLNILKNNLNKYNKYIEFIQTEEGKLEW